MTQMCTEMFVHNVRYLLQSNCPEKVFPILKTRMSQFLIECGKDTSYRATMDALGASAVRLATPINGVLVECTLTAHPDGNNFGLVNNGTF